MIKLSIIIPVYNTSKYLKHCIESLLTYDSDKYEVILVDDGSTDGSDIICDDFAGNYVNVKAFHKKNSGVSSSRNFGLKFASGEYVMFVDSDDTLRSGWSDIFEKEWREDVIYIDSRLKNKKGQRMLSCITGYPDTSIYIPGPTSKLFRRSFLEEKRISFDEEIIFAEDLLFNLEVLLNTKSIGIISMNIYNIRKTKDGLTRGFDEKIFSSTKKYIGRIDKLDIGVEGLYLKQIQIFNLALRLSRLKYEDYGKYIVNFEEEVYVKSLNKKYVVQKRFSPFLCLLKMKKYKTLYHALRVVSKVTNN